MEKAIITMIVVFALVVWPFSGVWQLLSDAEIWENFQKFPPLYQRVRIDTIQIKRKHPELFQSRLQKFLDNTKAGIMYGEWNDNGRLLTD